MGIFDRMGRVISSNANNLLDKAEDPKKLLALNIDEMEEQLKRAQKEVISAVAAEKQLRKKSEDLAGERDKWDKRAELALKSGDEALAREALKQERRVTAEVAETARVEQRNAALNMKQELERMREKLAEIKLKRGTITARAQKAAAGPGGEGLGAKGGASAFDDFRKMEEKIEGREAEASAMAEVDDALGTGPDKEDLEAKFRALEGSLGKADKPAAGGAGASDVDEELAALKKRIRV
jgi:phage shock protein A